MAAPDSFLARNRHKTYNPSVMGVPTRISASSSPLAREAFTMQFLSACASHNLDTITSFSSEHSDLNFPQCRDPISKQTGLHLAIAGTDLTSEDSVRGCERIVEVLLENGAIWNDLDAADRTPGDVAWEVGCREKGAGSGIWERLVMAGVRAELLFRALDNEDEDKMETDEVEEDGPLTKDGVTEQIASSTDQRQTFTVDAAAGANPQPPTTSPDAQSFLVQPVTHIHDSSTLVDSSDNAVMMSWETPLMKRTAELLLPQKGSRVLNIGYGLGIVDRALQACGPAEHHVIEPHPDLMHNIRRDWKVVEHKKYQPSRTGEGVTDAKVVESSHPDEGAGGDQAIYLHEGTWQVVLPHLADTMNGQFDAIFFDTFAEDYAAFQHFFEDFVPSLLKPETGVWSFFNGMGGDRRIVWSVMQKVCQMDLEDAGWEASFEEMETEDVAAELGRAGQKRKRDGAAAGIWEGVRRPYYVVEKYRIPIVRLSKEFGGG